jgi:hypothetical protein
MLRRFEVLQGAATRTIFLDVYAMLVIGQIPVVVFGHVSPVNDHKCSCNVLVSNDLST